jgi:UDP-glucose 4-epimerase
VNTWLVTGASGYVGSRLLEREREWGVSVVPCVRSPGKITQENLHVFADLSRTPLEIAIKPGTEAIIHLAQSNNYRVFPQEARDIVAVNIDSTAELVEQAIKCGARAFVFASTANVYGSNAGFVTEESPASPDSFYAASKLAAEHLLCQYSNLIDVYILRIFTVYGPGQKGKLFDSITTHIVEGIPISIVGNGLELTPVFLDDLVNVIGECAEGSIPPGTYNVCGSEELNLEEISIAIGKLRKKQPKFDRLAGKALRYCGSNRKLLQFRPGKNFVPFRAGVLSLGARDSAAL